MKEYHIGQRVRVKPGALTGYVGWVGVVEGYEVVGKGKNKEDVVIVSFGPSRTVDQWLLPSEVAPVSGEAT